MTQGHHETVARPALELMLRLTGPAHDHAVTNGPGLDGLGRGAT